MSNKASVKLGSLLSSLDSWYWTIHEKCPNATNTTLLLLMANFKFSVGGNGLYCLAEHSFHHDASNEVNLRKWSHITLTWDKHLKEVKMYGNGAKLNSSVLDAVTPQDAAIPIGSFLEIMSTEPVWKFSLWINHLIAQFLAVDGSHTRTRYCNDPSPDVYGLDCIGSNTSQIICNTDVCPSKIKDRLFIYN
ncbi:unnamed protein product [Mytilus edulis]|uniref:Uncharacterized protein n=1 Tax=Mytilus edulis TaxID=6550 RepID=A0A8S3UBW6_MYTED|nr:unnamed protein product [Mytilus edulis]